MKIMRDESSDGPRPDAASAARREDVVGLAKGGGFLVGGSFFDFVSRFIIGLLLARLLGPGEYGLYSLGISAAGIFAGISMLGLDSAMVRYIAILSARKDTAGVRGTIQIGLGIAIPVSVAMGLALYLLAPVVAVGMFSEPALTPVLRVMGVVVPFLSLSDVLLGITRGFGRMDHAAFGENVVQSLVRVVLLAGLALVGLDVYGAVIVFGIADVASAVVLIYFINRYFPSRPSAHAETSRDYRGVFGFAVPLWISGLLNTFRKNIQAVILGTTATSVSVGVFGIVGHVNIVGHSVYVAVTVAVKPLLARLHDQSDRDGLEHIYTTTTRWLVMSNIPIFMAMVLYPASILAIFGEAFTVGAAALAVMAAAELVNAATGICGSLIDMTGHTRVKLANSVLLLAVFLATNVLLIPEYGVLGAAVAYFIAIAVVNAARMIELWVLEKVLPSWRAYAKPLTAGALATAVGMGLKAVWPVGSAFWPALAQGIVVVVVYAGLIVLFRIEEDDRHILSRMVERLTSRFRRSGTEV